MSGGLTELRATHVPVLTDFPLEVHPYRKWWGTHWRLVELADLAVPPDTPGIDAAFDQELSWLAAAEHRARIVVIDGLVRRCASQEGNAVYAAAKLGRAQVVRSVVADLLEWQWPDGGWNCDRGASGRRSSFHESVTPALGLVAYADATGDEDARAAARRTAELLLEHRLVFSTKTGDVVDPSWAKPHYPPYWHYDVLQGLRLLHALHLLEEPRAADALDIMRITRRRDGKFSGPSWVSGRQRGAVDWGRGAANMMLNLRVEDILAAAP
jgi:hypothetical protein